MVAHNRIKEIEVKLQEALHPSYLLVDDESDQHIGHQGHQGGGHHFAITIASPLLVSLTRVEAHRLIYSALGDLMKKDVHALRIMIVV